MLAIVVLVFGACDRDGSTVEAPEADGPAVGDEVDETTQIRSEDWPDDPRRIVSMAPNTTEILFELGLGERVVAVTRFCDWPPEVEELSTVGGMLDPDHEAILGAEPQLVVGSLDGVDSNVVDQLERNDIAYGFVALDDVDSVRRGLRRLGDWLEIEDRSASFLERFDDRLKEASRNVDRQLKEGEHRTLLVVDRDPIVAAGPDSFGGDLLRYAGLENALGEEVDDYPILDIEKVLETDPEIVIDVTVEADDEAGERFWRDFDSLEAVAAGRVLHLDDPVMLRPGPRIPEAVQLLGEALESS